MAEDIIFGTVYLATETVGEIIDLTTDDFEYIMRRGLKNTKIFTQSACADQTVLRSFSIACLISARQSGTYCNRSDFACFYHSSESSRCLFMIDDSKRLIIICDMVRANTFCMNEQLLEEVLNTYYH